jgi:hypothetical protein
MVYIDYFVEGPRERGSLRAYESEELVDYSDVRWDLNNEEGSGCEEAPDPRWSIEKVG